MDSFFKKAFKIAASAVRSLNSTPKSNSENIEADPPLTPEDRSYDPFVCAVAGVTFKNDDGSDRQRFIRRRVSAGDHADLVREPKNKYDKNAVAVYVHNHKIGYLRADVTERQAKKMDDGMHELVANVRAVRGSDPVGVYLNIVVVIKQAAIDSGKVAVHNPDQPKLMSPKVDGMDIESLVKYKKDDLSIMAECCQSIISTYKNNPLENIAPINPSAFLRACILARKSKKYAVEVRVASAWLALVKQHDAHQLVTSGQRQRLASLASSQAIESRLEKAKKLMANKKTG